MKRLFFKVKILVLKMKFKLMKTLRRKKKSADFNIEEEARRLGMTVEDYRRNILLEKPKSRLNDIYDIHQHDVELVENEKRKFNDEIIFSTERKNAFRELDEFERYVESL